MNINLLSLVITQLEDIDDALDAVRKSTKFSNSEAADVCSSARYDIERHINSLKRILRCEEERKLAQWKAIVKDTATTS